MSDTPRTDAHAELITVDCDDSCLDIYIKQDGKIVDGDIVLADFARQLERELNAVKQELQDAVKRMEDVTDADLVLAYWAGSRSTLVHEGANRVRTRLIQAAKGEQP